MTKVMTRVRPHLTVVFTYTEGYHWKVGIPLFFILTEDDPTGNVILKVRKMCRSDEKKTFQVVKVVMPKRGCKAR